MHLSSDKKKKLERERLIVESKLEEDNNSVI